MNYDERRKRYQEYLKSTSKHSGCNLWRTNFADIAASVLTESDKTLDYYDDPVEGLRDRYSFREGAVCVLVEMYGLDYDYTREVMQTHRAWQDYVDARAANK